MGRNHYECRICGTTLEALADSRHRPFHCDEEMLWAPRQAPAVDANFSDPVTIDSGRRQFTVSSLHDIRTVERETETMARNGEGQPLVWRDYSQDKTNFDQHTLAKHMDRPVSGWAEGTTGVDGSKFRVRRGDTVRQDHGDADG